MLDFNTTPIWRSDFHKSLALPSLASFAIFSSIVRGRSGGDYAFSYVHPEPSLRMIVNLKMPGSALLGGASEARTGWKSS